MEFYRFFFVCVIYILHIRNYDELGAYDNVFAGGYLAVEFFFILSGFLMAKKCQKEQENAQKDAIPEFQSVKFFASRYKRLMPQYLISIVVLLVANSFIFENYNIKKTAIDSFSEIIGCSIFWRSIWAVNLHLWFVSGLIWAGALVYYLMLKHKNFSICVLFPFSLPLFIGCMYLFVGNIDITPASDIPMLAFFRAFVEIGFGCVLYNIYEYIRNKKFNPVVMTLVEIALFAIIVLIMWKTSHTQTDFIAVLLIGAFVLVTMLDRGYLSKLLNNRVSGLLGELSYPMYLNQLLFQNIARELFPDKPFWLIVVDSIAVLMIYSLIITYLLKLIAKMVSHLRKRKATKQG